ncbi:MAG: hypothetical protein AB6733_03120 [Clostridiaceae bacterium]
MSNLKLSKIDKSIFNSKAYKYLYKGILAIYGLLMMVYVFRDKLYQLGNQYISLFAGVAPNLIPSFLFTIIAVFYGMPIISKSNSYINKSKFIWIVNLVNIAVFALIEYLHVIFKLGVWDNKDIIASLVGIIIATIVYFKFKNIILDR